MLSRCFRSTEVPEVLDLEVLDIGGLAKDVLIGDREELETMMNENADKVSERLTKLQESDIYTLPDNPDRDIAELIKEAAHDDRELLGRMVEDISYNNARRYFKFY